MDQKNGPEDENKEEGKRKELNFVELRELYIKEYASENEFALKEKQLEQNKKKIISFYIAML